MVAGGIIRLVQHRTLGIPRAAPGAGSSAAKNNLQAATRVADAKLCTHSAAKCFSLEEGPRENIVVRRKDKLAF